MSFTDNPIADFNRWDAEQAREEAEHRETLPICVYCQQPIEDDWCYELDGECYCEKCMKENHRKWLI